MYSSHDMLTLVAEMNCRRIAMVAGARAKRLGGMHLLSENVHQILIAVRRLHHQYLKGHFEHTRPEAIAVIDLARWLIEEDALSKGITPRQPELKPELLEQTERIEDRKAYVTAVERITTGQLR